jgi:hypothetical protein
VRISLCHVSLLSSSQRLVTKRYSYLMYPRKNTVKVVKGEKGRWNLSFSDSLSLKLNWNFRRLGLDTRRFGSRDLIEMWTLFSSWERCLLNSLTWYVTLTCLSRCQVEERRSKRAVMKDFGLCDKKWVIISTLFIFLPSVIESSDWTVFRGERLSLLLWCHWIECLNLFEILIVCETRTERRDGKTSQTFTWS